MSNPDLVFRVKKGLSWQSMIGIPSMRAKAPTATLTTPSRNVLRIESGSTGGRIQLQNEGIKSQI